MSTVEDLKAQQPTINAKNIIYTSNVSTNTDKSHLIQALNNLTAIVHNSITCQGEQSINTYDHANINYPNALFNGNVGTIISGDLGLDMLNALGKDCVCHADCTEFAKWRYMICTCNSDCGCNYFSVNV